jgi:hypothetical protein
VGAFGSVVGLSVILTAATTIVYERDPELELSSIALTTNDDVPVALGDPVISPVLDIDKPAGRDPENKEYAYGLVPPLAVIC